MIDELRQIVIFTKVVQAGSFRGAANELRLSPSVVSHHISQLEEKLGFVLIYRTTRKLSLSKEGDRLFRSANEALETLQSEMFELSEKSGGDIGILNLTIPSVLSQTNLVDAIARFSQAHNKVDLNIDFSDQRRDIISDGLDIAIRMGEKYQKAQNRAVLFRCERILIVSSDVLANQQLPKHPSELSNWDWITLKPLRGRNIEFKHHQGDAVSVKAKTVIETNDAKALFQLALAGAGVSAVPDFLAEDRLRAGDVRQVLPEWSLGSLVVFADWPLHLPKHSLARKFVDFVTQDLEIGAVQTGSS